MIYMPLSSANAADMMLSNINPPTMYLERIPGRGGEVEY